MNEVKKQAAEKREYFRINNMVEIDYQLIPKEELPNANALAEYQIVDTSEMPVHIISKINEIDQKQASLLSSISKNNPLLAKYLKTVNEKFQLITKLQTQQANKNNLQQVNLSAGGVAFLCPEALPLNSYIKIKLIFYPNYQGIVTLAQVLDIFPDASTQETDNLKISDYYTRLKFINLSKENEEIIIRQVMLRQSEAIRNQKSADPPEK